MSSTKANKKRTLPTVPQTVVNSPKPNGTTNNTEIKKQTPARALCQGNNRDASSKQTDLSGGKRLSKIPNRINTSKPNTPVSSSPQLSRKQDLPRLSRKQDLQSKLSKAYTPSKKNKENNKVTELKKYNNKNISNDGASDAENIVNNVSSENTHMDTSSILQEKASIVLKAGNEYEKNYDNSSITVAVRVRPFSSREIAVKRRNIVTMNGNVTMLKNPANGKYHEFVYDYSFWSSDALNQFSNFISQEDVYHYVAKPLLDCSFDGYNTCLFAYGQTGSGKSYTIMGYEDDETGVVPRFSKDLFDKIYFLEEQDQVRYSVEISFYEIYNEKIFDLLSFSEGSKQRLCVREHPDYGPYVQGLSSHIVGTLTDIQDWLEVGNKNRATAATGMNDKSSRSHSVFTIILTQVKTEQFEGTETQLHKTSKINLIDLAGSERASKVLEDGVITNTQIMNTRLKEGGCINKSLHTLGKVISSLAGLQLNLKKKSTYIPYRDSVLTWLLKESLGGNSKTTMLATISPAHIHYAETLSTLRYAQEARSIINIAKVNEDPKSKLIREMLAEIQNLKESQQKSGDFGHAFENEVMLLRQKLKDTHDALATSTRTWQEKLEQSEKKQKEAASHLRRSGVAFRKLEHHLPSLVNLNEDPQLAEVLLYILQEGITNVGSKETGNEHDIQLRGNLVADHHCTFRYNIDAIVISPEDDAPTYVNGMLICEETKLHHGDRIVVGGDHFFRLNHPKEAAKLKEEFNTDRRKSVKNFEFAKDELLQKQNQRLEAELEEARMQAEKEAMEQIKQAQTKVEEEMKAQRSFFEQQLDLLQQKLDDTTGKKKEAEEDHQSAQEIINQLRAHQKVLEEEILANRKKLQIEALAAKQIIEETKMNQMQLFIDLEREKKQIQDDVDMMRNAKNTHEWMRSSITVSVNQPNEGPEHRDLLKISLMLREANKICQNLKQDYVFTRDDLCTDGEVEIRIRMKNIKLTKYTVLSLQKFEEELTRMKDIPEGDLFDENEFQWMDDFEDDSKNGSFRMSISNRNSISMMSSQSIEMAAKKHQSLNDTTTHPSDNVFYNHHQNNTDIDISRLCNSTLQIESTRLSAFPNSMLAGTQNNTADVSALKASWFETILENKAVHDDVSIVARLTKLIFNVYGEWNKISLNELNFTHQNVDDVDQPLIRIACCMKSLKDLASVLCSVHEAVGLDELKTMSYSFKQDVEEASSYIKNSVLLVQIKSDDWKIKFKQLILQMVELASALSLAAVDHIKIDDDVTYFEEGSDNDLCVFFLKQQNRFLTAMVTEASCTVNTGIEDLKNLQLSSCHEMSEDLVDGVMNILTSTTTLLQCCKDLLNVYADVSVSRCGCYYAKECFLLRKMLSSVVDYNESIHHLVEQSKHVAKDCDSLDQFLGVPIELADTTKCICSAGKELSKFVSLKKGLDQKSLSLLQDCLEKFEFTGKTVRVGVAIVVQEVERDLNINEGQSVASFIQTDIAFAREQSMCPLNRTSLDMSSLNPQLQDRFRLRKSSVRPDLFISRYMDTSEL